MAITAERKTKYQKNSNVHECIYYRCTKKSKSSKCSKPFVREEELDRQLSQEIEKFALPVNWAKQLSQMADEDEQKLAQSSASFIEESRIKLENLNIKIQRLLDAYLEQDIEREIYRAKKNKASFGQKDAGGKNRRNRTGPK
jgi:phosphorylcholine metabolism protein LicD